MQKTASCIGAFFHKRNHSVISRWEGGFLQYFPFKSLPDSFDILLFETDPSASLQFHMSSPKHVENIFWSWLHQHQKPGHPCGHDLLIMASSQRTRLGRWWQTKVSTPEPLSKAKCNTHQPDLHKCMYSSHRIEEILQDSRKKERWASSWCTELGIR